MKCKPEMLAEPKKIWYDESVSRQGQTVSALVS